MRFKLRKTVVSVETSHHDFGPEPAAPALTVPSSKKVAAVGARLDVPLTHLAWSYVGSHYGAIEMGVPDEPRPDKPVFIVAMASGGRVHARFAGGFTLADRGTPGVPV